MCILNVSSRHFGSKTPLRQLRETFCSKTTFWNKKPPGNEPPPIDEKGAVRMS